MLNEDKNYLSFSILEEIMGLPDEIIGKVVSNTIVKRISPLVELIFHSHDSYDFTFWQNSKELNSLKSVLQSGSFTNMPAKISASPSPFEFIRTPNSHEEADDAKWQSYVLRMEKAAQKAGLEKDLAKALAGTMEEMVDNIIRHSERSDSGVVGYRFDNKEFEYIVADAGIGILESLKRNAGYAWIIDSSQAIQTAIQNGETRFGKHSGHGAGFNRLLNITKRDSYLRFRSGNYSYSFDGINANARGNVQAKDCPCANFQGFLISLTSRSPKNDK